MKFYNPTTCHFYLTHSFTFQPHLILYLPLLLHIPQVLITWSQVLVLFKATNDESELLTHEVALIHLHFVGNSRLAFPPALSRQSQIWSFPNRLWQVVQSSSQEFNFSEAWTPRVVNSLNKISDPPGHNLCLFVCFYFISQPSVRKHALHCNPVTHIYICYWNPYFVQCILPHLWRLVLCYSMVCLFFNADSSPQNWFLEPLMVLICSWKTLA